MSLKYILKTSLEDVFEHLKTFRPVVLKTYFQSPQDQFSNVLQPKLDALFETVKYCFQHVFIAVLKPVSKTDLQDVYEDLKSFTDPSFGVVF